MNVKKVLLASASAAVVVAVLTTGAHAAQTVIAAFAGQNLDNATPVNCTREISGGVAGTGAGGACLTPFPSSSPRWEIALPVRATGGGEAIAFYARGNGADGPSCTAYMTDETKGIALSSGSAQQKNFGVSGSPLLRTTIPTFTIPANSSLFFVCEHLTDSNFIVGSVEYTAP